MNSPKAFTDLATAKYWVDNFPKPIFMFKGRNQIYIQTWHGDRGFKKILYDCRTLLPNGRYKEGDLLETNNCDLMVAGSNYGERKFRSAFGYKGAIMKVGCPRNDRLINGNAGMKQWIRENLNIDDKWYVLLFAPTYRRKSKQAPQSTSLDLSAVISALESKTGQEWVGLVRTHSASEGLTGIPLNDTRIRDVSEYEDMAELLLISDFLVTDYSSSAGDFALLNRPVVLFQPDMQDYSQDRGFYFTMEDSPYKRVSNQQELLDLIMNMDWTKIGEYCQDILGFYKTVETGRASECVVEFVLNGKGCVDHGEI